MRSASLQPSGHVVLLVEDDPAIRDMVEQLLVREGYSVRTAADGAAGLARIKAGGIDLVLLDALLPKLHGFELCRRVRAQEGEVYLPIIMLTGLTDAADRHAGFVAGADDYVTKPFSVEALLARVRVWLGVRARLAAANTRLLQTQERLREREGRRLCEVRAQNEAVLLMMEAPLTVLLKLLVRWETSQLSPEAVACVRADLEAAASELAAQATQLNGLLHGHSLDGSSAGADAEPLRP